MGREGAGRRARHQHPHLPLVDRPLQQSIAVEGVVHDLSLLPRGAEAEEVWEHRLVVVAVCESESIAAYPTGE